MRWTVAVHWPSGTASSWSRICPTSRPASSSLRDSTIATFKIDGDLGLLIQWGGGGAFALSVGGFNPRYQDVPPQLAGMSRIVIDPVTSIEGHLRIEAEVEGGQVRDAWSSSTMFRGIEIILRGRDPRDAWAFTQRICGVCTTVHAIA